MTTFQIIEQKHPPCKLPFRLLEIYQSSDGPRTRVVDGGWSTYMQAEFELKRRSKVIWVKESE